ncbi:Crp/Fnr family transcriptional regulator [Methylobacterium sp. J-076]|uniref:Crp/Fnr family transcriptional regulator n=1 Tax=Methylobacterium sp. J-076 TaxID=2836655 RepID=UPI001FBB35F7|nr:Crp/Fnr family transcriptional regulator [Methylobacterium sp. J-076]MCJ2011769.1 Crp/Fnr family transcriptional regulator [Methylobacterium sp. J-076]
MASTGLFARLSHRLFVATGTSMTDATHRLVQRIGRIFSLNEDERHALATVPIIMHTFASHQDIVQEGDQPGQCCLIVAGWACRYRILQHGGRQILSFHIPGDLPNIHGLHLPVTDHSLAAVTTVTVGFVSHAQIHDLIAEHPRLGSAFWKDTLIDAAIYRERIVGMGRKEALPRIAHFFCEVFLRMQAVDLTTQHSCSLPITQTEMSDALGLSSVHVSRVLRDLRHQEFIALDHRTLTILDWSRLMALAEFNPTYLHQDISVPT